MPDTPPSSHPDEIAAFTNVQVRTEDAAAVAECLAPLIEETRALVLRPQRGWVAVLSPAAASLDDLVLETVLERLSRRLGKATFAVRVEDGTRLRCWVHDQGRLALDVTVSAGDVPSATRAAREARKAAAAALLRIAPRPFGPRVVTSGLWPTPGSPRAAATLADRAAAVGRALGIARARLVTSWEDFGRDGRGTAGAHHLPRHEAARRWTAAKERRRLKAERVAQRERGELLWTHEPQAVRADTARIEGLGHDLNGRFLLLAERRGARSPEDRLEALDPASGVVLESSVPPEGTASLAPEGDRMAWLEGRGPEPAARLVVRGLPSGETMTEVALAGTVEFHQAARGGHVDLGVRDAGGAWHVRRHAADGGAEALSRPDDLTANLGLNLLDPEARCEAVLGTPWGAELISLFAATTDALGTHAEAVRRRHRSPEGKAPLRIFRVLPTPGGAQVLLATDVGLVALSRAERTLHRTLTWHEAGEARSTLLARMARAWARHASRVRPDAFDRSHPTQELHVRALTVDPNGRWAASLSLDGFLRWWSLPGLLLLRRDDTGISAPSGLWTTPGGRSVIAGSHAEPWGCFAAP